MSELSVTIPLVTIDRLIHLRQTDPDEYADQLMTETVHLCRRPGDIERVAHKLDELIARISR